MFGTKEKENYSFLYLSIQDEKLKQRAKLSMDFYIEKANKYKVLGEILSILSIVLPALGTYASFMVNSSPIDNILISGIIPFITATTSSITGIIALFKITEKKISYRNSAETLKSVLMNYYFDKNETSIVEKSELLLQKNIEKIIQDGYSKIRNLEEKIDKNS